jgi:murein DD-endopeptidase MepM/ murein hydrolase activator NlpD
MPGMKYWRLLNRNSNRLGFAVLAIFWLLPGCKRLISPPDVITTIEPSLQIINRDQPESIPSLTVVTPSKLALCSPLADIDISELTKYVSNPFVLPEIQDARDGGHHGVDFAYYTHPETGRVMLGSPIFALLAGRVVTVSADKPPYGNLVIIETPFDRIPEKLSGSFTSFPRPTPGNPETHLSCPDRIAIDQDWEFNQPSIYVLYAHMDKPSGLNIDDQVSCGREIGLVGSSGNSVNPHLHLEIRYGPGNASFESLAHYSDAATSEEMAAYCTWRVSGLFQAIDPMIFIQASYLK